MDKSINFNPKISLAMDLRDLLCVIESLPEGHDLLPYLKEKANTLFAVYKLKHKKPEGKHEIWCVTRNDCRCLFNREEVK